jgi:hypothetical protein
MDLVILGRQAIRVAPQALLPQFPYPRQGHFLYLVYIFVVLEKIRRRQWEQVMLPLPDIERFQPL